MEVITEQTQFSQWLIEYGSIAVFFLLMAGIIALPFPVPEETLMIIAGVFMHQGKLLVFPTFFAAYTGAFCGITVSYIVGRTVGIYFVHRYGSWFGFGEERVAKAHTWFERFGKWGLFFGYFLPGIRHFTGLLAGVTALRYKEFALFAYSGAVIWVSLFLCIGYFFGRYWIAFFDHFEFDVEKIIILLVSFIILLILYKFWNKRRSQT